MGQVKCCVSVFLSIIYLLLGIGYSGRISGRSSPLVLAQDEPEPEFLAQLTNITVSQGRDVSFTCVVNNLGPYKVAWIKSDSKAILGIHTHMVSLNPRLSVTHNGHNTWKLHISHVQLNDSGSYMCQVNTDPMKSLSGYLDVVVPPDILNHPEQSLEESSCNEGGSITLICSTTGVPQPAVQWRREGGKDIILRTETRDKQVVKSVDGEKLFLSNVHRTDMGGYLCIASNGVPPSVSKRFDVHVNFQPTTKAVNQLLGAPVEREVTLECIVEVYPKPLNGWYRNEGNLKLHNGSKYNITEALINLYTWHLNLTIRHLSKSDFGAYSCSSVNALGKSEARIRLQELRLPPKATTTPTPYVPATAKPRRKQPATVGHNKGPNEVVVCPKKTLHPSQMQENEILSVVAAPGGGGGGGGSSGFNQGGKLTVGEGGTNSGPSGAGAGVGTGRGAAGIGDGRGGRGLAGESYPNGGSAANVNDVGMANGAEVLTQLPTRNGYERTHKSPAVAPPTPRTPLQVANGGSAAAQMRAGIRTTNFLTFILFAALSLLKFCSQ